MPGSLPFHTNKRECKNSGWLSLLRCYCIKSLPFRRTELRKVVLHSVNKYSTREGIVIFSLFSHTTDSVIHRLENLLSSYTQKRSWRTYKGNRQTAKQKQDTEKTHLRPLYFPNAFCCLFFCYAGLFSLWRESPYASFRQKASQGL